jgi:hypothetical protein
MWGLRALGFAPCAGQLVVAAAEVGRLLGQQADEYLVGLLEPVAAFARAAGFDALDVGPKSAHRSEPVFELAVVGLDRVVGILLDVVPRRRDEVVEHGRVDRCGVGDDLVRRHLQHP